MSLVARRLCLSATLKRAAIPSFGSVSVFSTQSSNDNQGTKRLSLSLYRQLLQWCDATDPQVPLSSYFPPVSLSAPYVDAKQLERLFAASRQTSFTTTTTTTTTTQLDRILEWLPQSKFKADEWTTFIRFANDIRNLIRAVYRINSSSNPDDRKLQISFAFETLRSLNQHTKALLELQQEQAEHSNRQDVEYQVGQVVQHKQEKWRAVIVEWNRPKQQPQNNTSLTTKDYTDTVRHVVQYTLLMDTGDVHLLGKGLSTNIISDTQHSSYTTTTALPHELEPLTNPRLCRIRNRDIARHFDRYDSWSNSFVPNALTQYKYPLDYDTSEHASKQTLTTIRYQQGRELPHDMTLEDYNSIAHDIVTDVQYVAQHLQDCIAQELKQHVGNLPPLDALTLLTDFQKRLAVLTDDFDAEQLPVPKAAIYLRQLLNISYSVAEALARRKLPHSVRARIRFQVGDIVRHTQYNFRGVVVAWDEQPTVDVSYWDGLQDIPDASTKPFYHVIPVQSDCIQAFGGERPSRYVCQDNLELCPVDQRQFDVELESGWQRDPSRERFLAPQAIKFGYGLDIGDRDITETCLTLVQSEFAKLFVSARDVVPSNTCSTDRAAHDKESEEPRLSFNKLFCLLKVCHSVDHAMVIEETLKDMWKAHTSPEIRREFETGMACLLRGNQQEQALSIFRNVLDQDASYAEAWNKVSTCEYMLGNMPASLKAAKRVLELQPRHFQALNGIGLVYWESKNYDLAVESFAKSLDLDPWSPVSSRFASCLDIVETKKALASDEEASEEASEPEKASAPEWSFSKSPNVESEK